MKRKRKYILLALLLIFGSVILGYGFSLAKYAANSAWDYHLKSKGFYFSSDYLDIDSIKNVDNLWDGGSVDFNIKNNLNQSVVTSFDIDYTVTCAVDEITSAYAECQMNGTGTDTYTGTLAAYQTCVNVSGDQVDVSSMNKTDCELGGYDWVSQVATSDLYFDVVLTETGYEVEDVTVSVTASSTSPYSKTISGDFQLHKSDLEEGTVSLDYSNYSNYDRLTISNSYSSDKCVTISWNSDNLVIDKDYSTFSNYSTDLNGYINEVELTIGGKNSLSYIFYSKEFNTTYDVSEFTIVESCSN